MPDRDKPLLANTNTTFAGVGRLIVDVFGVEEARRLAEKFNLYANETATDAVHEGRMKRARSTARWIWEAIHEIPTPRGTRPNSHEEKT